MTQFNEDNKNNNQKKYLEQLISCENAKIFIDTCSMLEDSFPLFVEHVHPLLEKYQQRIIVPLAVSKELIKQLDNPKRPELQEAAIRALGLLDSYRESCFRILGNERDSFPDNLFQDIQIRFRQRFHMIFITQDKALTADILNNNCSNSVQGYAARVKKIMPNGYLGNSKCAYEDGRWVVLGKKSVSVESAGKGRAKNAFRICKNVTSMPDELLSVRRIPGESNRVIAVEPATGRRANLVLGKCIASGGEGDVYEINTKFVAKIYKADKLTKRREEKICRMVKKELTCEGICFPLAPLFNLQHEFVGYLMSKAVGEELRTSVFCPVQRFREKHPDWKRAELVQICLTILEKINYLHSMNVIMGDINPGNILVNSPTEVFFVDTDSYQIEEFPCPVGQCNYTAPEIQGREYNSFLRTIGNENFALATLLFQILLPGKLPYSHAGGGKQNENILEMNFPYRLGENGNRNEPGGPWKFMWSHLSYSVKDAFYNTFQKGGKYSEEGGRLSGEKWSGILTHYLELLQKGTLAQQDFMSESIFPTRYKAGREAKWTICKHCGESFPYYESKSKKSSNPPAYCSSCYQKVQTWIVCTDCGEEVPIRIPEYDFYMEKGYQLPKRCTDCRKKQKEVKKIPVLEPEIKVDTKSFFGKWVKRFVGA